ncbi:uncharacterized protein LOC131956792 isoform X2 [Physella acuta]|uniref:uncharacterized protein LOC131956792 isoform X2 n=1 Tax=Physella acuta TaxID=109671 RepID=UPI0027DB0485|nr:uncharacterized protein LOC131956792 isoform X2 [Physella acuta]
MATALLRDRLPPGCQIGVTQDGRVFFIDDTRRTTSWLHPVTGEPVSTGLQTSQDLPPGWEEDITPDGRVYYVDHTRQVTTFNHPVYGYPQPPDVAASSIAVVSPSPSSPTSPGSYQQEHFKRGTVKQRSVKAPSSKRNPDSEVIKRGWLYRLETSGISKSWKKRWCVLADFALFIYKDEDEALTLNSILLPSYRINPCTEADNIKRNFAFKVEHENTKTLYFATDNSTDLFSWMSLLTQAAIMNGNGFQRETMNMRQHPLKAMNKPTYTDPRDHDPRGQSYQYNPNGQVPNGGSAHNNSTNPKANLRLSQSSSYRGYEDPAKSPLGTPLEPVFTRPFENPPPVELQRHQNRVSLDGSNTLSNSSFRGPQVNPTLERRVNPNQSQSSRSLSGSSRDDPRLQPQPLRDGFAPDSARSSLAQSESSHTGAHQYSPVQAEKQRLQQQLGYPLRNSAEPHKQVQDPQRDSYSDFDAPVKQLHKWDENFPDLEAEKLKHSSFDDLLEGGRGRHPDTFNVRSKSHENFSRLPERRDQPPVRSENSQPPHGSLRRDQAVENHFPGQPYRDGPQQSRPNMQQAPNQRGSLSNIQQVPNQRGSFSNMQPNQRGSLSSDRGQPNYTGARSTNPGSSQNISRNPQGSASHSNLTYGQPNPAFRGSHQLLGGPEPHSNGDPMRGSLRDARGQADPRHMQHPPGAPQQDRRSYSSTSSSHAAPSNPAARNSGNPRQFDPHQQQASLPHPGQQHSDLHLNLKQPYNPHTYNNQSSPDSYFPPDRPPYPSSMRQQIVEEIAQTKTPVTQKDFLTASNLSMQRMQQPSYFQYPSPRDQPPSYNRSLQNNPPTMQSNQMVRNEPNSRLSNSSQASLSSQTNQKHSPHSPPDSMMDPEAQKLRMAYGRVNSLRMAPDKAPPRRQAPPIQTVKEDPNMSDRDILETNLQKLNKKNPLNGPRVRMSISAGDLIGKTHDELVLFLIQLRRNQAALENTKEMYHGQLEQRRPGEMEYRKQMQQYGGVQDRRLFDNHQSYLEAKSQMEEIDNKLEVYKPIINLLDNMVTMGSLYGGDNLMLATQYRKHLLRPDQYQPPKKMLEFSRKLQEERLKQETESEIKKLSSDEVDLEEKIDRLNELDRLLQEQSFKVSSYREDKEIMEKALSGVLKQQDQYSNDPREMRRLSQQQRTLEREISRVTQQLALASKELEETSAENNKLEHEIALLRTKVNGELNRSKSAPSLATENGRTKEMMEQELAKVEGIMQGLSKEGERLSQAMSTIRRSSSSSQLASALDKDEAKKKSNTTYLQTDLDTGEQVDLATTPSYNSRPPINHQRQNANTQDDWDMEGADENTKRFFGLIPREKPKALTVRDVKRQAEQRKEKERQQKKEDDGEEIKLRVSNVDNESSSIIHARIPSEASGHWENGHPLYENLPRYAPVASNVPESHSAPGSRRSSLILLAPKPFTPYQDKSTRPFRSELALNSAGDPLFSANTSSTNNQQSVPASDVDRPYHSVEMLSQLDSRSTNKVKVDVDSSIDRNNNGPTNLSRNDYSRTNGQFHAVPYNSQTTLTAASSHTDTNRQTGTDNVHEQDPPASAAHIIRPVNFSANQTSLAYTARPWTKSGVDWDNSLFKKNLRGRHLTISSSEPLRLEMNPTLHNSAGDLIMNKTIDDVPDIVKSSQTKMDQIDADIIDREVLYIPEKVLIPERYDADADAEHLTEEDKIIRQEKAERIKRMLASQSVLSLSQQDLHKLPQYDIHKRAEQVKHERAQILTMNQELARQVTQKTKKQAAERRKTWSGAQFQEIRKQYEEGNMVN